MIKLLLLIEKQRALLRRLLTENKKSMSKHNETHTGRVNQTILINNCLGAVPATTHESDGMIMRAKLNKSSKLRTFNPFKTLTRVSRERKRGSVVLTVMTYALM